MIKRISDYIYYRLYKFYQSWDTDPKFTSALGVAMTQFLIPVDIGIFISRFFVGRENTYRHAKTIAYAGGFVLILFTVFNAIYYSKRHKLVIEELFVNESSSAKKRNGYLVVAVLLFPWIWLVVLGRSGF